MSTKPPSLDEIDDWPLLDRLRCLAEEMPENQWTEMMARTAKEAVARVQELEAALDQMLTNQHALSARLLEMTADNVRLKESSDTWFHSCEALEKEQDRLEAEIATLRAPLTALIEEMRQVASGRYVTITIDARDVVKRWADHLEAVLSGPQAPRKEP